MWHAIAPLLYLLHSYPMERNIIIMQDISGLAKNDSYPTALKPASHINILAAVKAKPLVVFPGIQQVSPAHRSNAPSKIDGGQIIQIHAFVIRRGPLPKVTRIHESREVVVGDAEMQTYLEKMTPYQRQILSNPSLYTGIAAKKAKVVAEKWKQKLGL